MPTVLITGGSGTIGKRLSQMLADKGYGVIVLTRQPITANNIVSEKISFARWDVSNNIIDKDAVLKADYIIHLAGAGVADKRWTKSRKEEIQQSRTKSSALIVTVLKENSNKVKAVISASAIGWYGGDLKEKPEAFTETDMAADNFLGETCRLWEESIQPVAALGKRLVILRTGIVLSNSGGAFTEFKKPLKAGVAAILGNGEQIISWIHTDDICRMYIYAIENENIAGVYNAVAPKPISNKILVLLMAKLLRGKFFISIHIPSFVLKLMLGQMSIEILKSATVSSTKIKETEFQFLYPSAEAAVKGLIK